MLQAHLQRGDQGRQKTGEIENGLLARYPFLEKIVFDSAPQLADVLFDLAALEFVEMADSQSAIVLRVGGLAQPGEFVQPKPLVVGEGLADVRPEIGNQVAPESIDGLPLLVPDLLRQNAFRQDQVLIRQKPLLLRFLEANVLSEILLHRLLRIAQRSAPVVEMKLQDGLPRQRAAQILPDLLFWIGDLFDPEGEKPPRTLRSVAEGR